MSVHDDVSFPGNRLLNEVGGIHGDIVVMTVCQKNPVSAETKLLFPVQIAEKIVVAGDDLRRAARKLPDPVLLALHIPAVDQHVKGRRISYGLFQVLQFSVSITDDENSHMPRFLSS